MFERHSGGDSAILVSLTRGQPDADASSAELKELARSAGLEVVAEIAGRSQPPNPSTFAGSGKVQEIASELARTGSQLVIFDHELSPAQERNLERALSSRVLDRTSLILDIFAQRAKSHEGKLQVELAQLEHIATRLVRGWTHLERQKGGIGLRGPGETQLETDRRLLAKRVKFLKDRLSRLEKQRKVQRRSRDRNAIPSVSLVGYTNAGKSTLFNALTRSGAYAADQLFATLDTTSRRVHTAHGPIVLSDTVGFIRHLPHTLVEAFRATLDETTRADLLLHVVDASSPDRDAQMAEVDRVLAEIGASDVRQIIVYNKIDRTELSPGVERDDCDTIRAIRLSAVTGSGLDHLRAVFDQLTEPRSDPSLEGRLVAA
ncbi:MAG: GTPase HflX [Betaproteobacteria bacterium]|nr:GTPase HflX [Betaproteobacteria bacterium]